MPILQGAQEVHIDGCDFRDVRGNYYDYGNGRPANGPEYSRVSGQINQRSIPGPVHPDLLNGFEHSPGWRERLQGRTDAGSETVLSQLAGNAANPPPSSRSPQINPFNSNQYWNAVSAVNGGPSASPQTPEGAFAGGPYTNNVPAPNGSFAPNPAGVAPANSRANSGSSAFLSDLSYTASFTGTNGMNAEAFQAFFSPSPSGWQDNSQGPQFQIPNNVNSPAQRFHIRNSSSPSLQSLNNTNSSTLRSQSPNNTNASTETFQLLSRNTSASEMPVGATHSGRATNDSILPERSTTYSPMPMSPEQSTAALPANARRFADTNNEALAQAPLEKGAGFLGF